MSISHVPSLKAQASLPHPPSQLNDIPSYVLRKQKQPEEMAHIHPSLHSNLCDSALHSHCDHRVNSPARTRAPLLPLCTGPVYSPLYKDIAPSAGPCLLPFSSPYKSLSYLEVISQPFFFFLTLHLLQQLAHFSDHFHSTISQKGYIFFCSHIQFKELNQFKKESN